MKRYFLVLISLLLTLSLFIACDNGSKAPSSTTEENLQQNLKLLF